MKKIVIVYVCATFLMALVGCVSAERKAEYQAWQASDDGQAAVTLEEFELKHKDGWRVRADEKKKIRLLREAKEKAEAARQAEYSAWCQSDDTVKDVDLATFEQKYKEGWRDRAAEKQKVRLAKERAEREEKERQAKMKAESERMRKARKTYIEKEVKRILDEIRQAEDKEYLKAFTYPRIKVSETERLAGEALLSDFGSKYLPNAFGNYEKLKDAATEIQQVFNEEFPTPSKMNASDPKWSVYNKVLGRLVQVRTELFTSHDELVHYWMQWRFGVVKASELAEVDALPLGVRLLPENVARRKYSFLKLTELNSKCLDFMAKYAPESNAAYQKMLAEWKEVGQLIAEVDKQRLQLDSIRFDRCYDAAVWKKNNLARMLNELAQAVEGWYFAHRTMDKTSEEIARDDQAVVKSSNEFIRRLPTYVKDRVIGPIIPVEDMVSIPGRCFKMQRFELTQFQWMYVMGEEPTVWRHSKGKCEGMDRPVIDVSHDDVCKRFLPALNNLDGRCYTLPTSKEWKYACLAGSKGKFCKRKNGLDGPITEMGWLGGTYSQRIVDGLTQPVGFKESNPWGIYDMYRNVPEWCSDVESIMKSLGENKKLYFTLGGNTSTQIDNEHHFPGIYSGSVTASSSSGNGFRLICEEK